MSIATAITAAQGRVADCYTAISNKGGTLPATQNLSNMPTAISSIPGGSSGYTEIPPYQVSNGLVSRRSGALTGNEFSNVTSVGSNGLYYAFYNCTGLTGLLDLSSLTNVDSNGLYYAFYGCSGLTGALDLSSLSSVSDNGLYSAFSSCTGLTSVDLSSLTSVGNSSLYAAFYNCPGLTGALDLSSLSSVGNNGLYNSFYGSSRLTSVDLSSLSSIGNAGLRYMFAGCTELTDVYFNSLTTSSFGSYKNQFQNLLSVTGTSKTHTLHFPSNLSSKISTLTGYPTFGGTSGYVTLSFDLPATS